MSRRGLLLFAAMCVIWGVPYLLIRVAVGEISPATLVFVRTAIAAVILLPFVLARGGWRSIGGRWPAVVAFATVEVAAPRCQTTSMTRCSSSLSGFRGFRELNIVALRNVAHKAGACQGGT